MAECGAKFWCMGFFQRRPRGWPVGSRAGRPFWCMGFCRRDRRYRRQRRWCGRGDSRVLWCMGFLRRIGVVTARRSRERSRRAPALNWCMGFFRRMARGRRRGGWQGTAREAGGALGLPRQHDGLLPRCKGCCLRTLHGAVLGRRDAGGRVRRHPKLRRVLLETRHEFRRQPVAVPEHRAKHPAAASVAQDAAVAGALPGAVIAMDGAGGGDAGTARLGARAGAAAAMHAAPLPAADGWRAAGAACAGVGAAAGSQREVRVAPALAGGVRGRRRGRGRIGRGNGGAGEGRWMRHGGAPDGLAAGMVPFPIVLGY